MYQFTGCPCSVCGKTLTDTDDIVVCPDCGAPYHRACYQAQGACVYAGKHGTGFEWTPPASAQPEHKCPNCGAPNPESAQRCSHCGYVFGSEQAAPPPRVDANRQAQQPGGGFNYTRLYQEGGSISIWLDDENISVAAVSDSLLTRTELNAGTSESPQISPPRIYWGILSPKRYLYSVWLSSTMLTHDRSRGSVCSTAKSVFDRSSSVQEARKLPVLSLRSIQSGAILRYDPRRTPSLRVTRVLI